MIRICICDDKNEDLELLAGYTRELADENTRLAIQTDFFHTPYEVEESVRQSGGYDLYILDVLMPHIDGIELARRLRERGEQAKIIFLTVSREYAVDAFRVKASGYLIKPVSKADFFNLVAECLDSISEADQAILIKTKEGVRKILACDITMVESFDHERVITLAGGDAIITSETLSSLYGRFRKGFFRPHRAYIINLDYVKGLSSAELIMNDGYRVPISRKLYGDFKKAYMDHTFRGLK